MPLFLCSECGSVENTALGEYWMNKHYGEPVRCSECATGQWHGEFPKERGTADVIARIGAEHFVDGTAPIDGGKSA